MSLDLGLSTAGRIDHAGIAVDLGLPISFSRHSGEWCNWQHSRFWFCYSGFDSLLPNKLSTRRAAERARIFLRASFLEIPVVREQCLRAGKFWRPAA